MLRLLIDWVGCHSDDNQNRRRIWDLRRLVAAVSHCTRPLTLSPNSFYSRMQSTRTLRLTSTLLRNATASKSTSPTIFSGRLKQSTNITGLAIQSSPLSDLTSTYNKTLSILTSLPEESVYRQATQALIQHRNSVVEQFNLPSTTSTPSLDNNDFLNKHEEAISRVEQELDAGQIEEVLVQAKDELELATKMIDWQP